MKIEREDVLNSKFTIIIFLWKEKIKTSKIPKRLQNFLGDYAKIQKYCKMIVQNQGTKEPGKFKIRKPNLGDNPRNRRQFNC